MISRPSFRSHVTLFLCMILHAFTHAYGSLFVPLYLLMTADLHLTGVKRATLLVSLYSLVYCLGSYAAGVLSDRFNRKALLGIGLLANAAAITCMGLTHSYALLLALACVAGVGGTIFHPTAGALVPSHYPASPGMAVGLLGIGSGIGFFVGPQYAGWRAQTAKWSWSWIHISQWQKPCIELGLGGLAVGLLFLLIAKESSEPRTVAGHSRPATPLDRGLTLRMLAIGAILGFRDFAGVGGFTLAGLYLLRAHHFSAEKAGMVLGPTMLLSVVVNPMLVWLTPGRRRVHALRMALVLGGLVAVTVPFFSAAWALPVLCTFQTCQLGSYALSDAALLERVPGWARGRVYGLFFTVAGTLGSLGPWIMGKWTDALHQRADHPSGFIWPFATLGLGMFLATAATPIIARLGPATQSVDPFTETMPTMEPVG